MKHVISYSGGVGSWAAAKRVAARYGTKDIVLLFADTLIEDEDLYRFLHESAANVGVPITRIADGRTPWEVFKDKRFIGNARVDKCSQYLKRILLDKWRNENCDPADTISYVGLDWTEVHRLDRLKRRKLLFRFEAPLCDPPYLSKRDILSMVTDNGMKRPRLYDMGFPHNNCGGFCVKAGQAQFALLLRTMPERYAYHEEQEEKMRAYLGKDVSILRDRRGGTVKALTLKEFRRRVEADDYDKFDFGGCGCAID